MGRYNEYQQRVMMPCAWGVKAGMIRVCVWVAGKTNIALVTHGPYLSTLRDKGLIIKCYINSYVYFFTFYYLGDKRIITTECLKHPQVYGINYNKHQSIFNRAI